MLAVRDSKGMERPVRSFKSFIKTVPPNPQPSPNEKPLPPAPSPAPREKSPIPSPPTAQPPSSPASSTARSSSAGAWRAPAEWTSSPRPEESLSTPPIPASRQYSPLIPEPSPDPIDFMDITIAPADTLQSQNSRLMPIYERADVILGPPHSPPRSPLPIPPKSPSRPKVPDGTQPVSQGHRSPLKAGSVPGHEPSRNGRNAGSATRSGVDKKSPRATKDKMYATRGSEKLLDQTAHAINRRHLYNPSSGSDPGPSNILLHPRPEESRGRTLNRGYTAPEDHDSNIDDRLREWSIADDHAKVLTDQSYDYRTQGDDAVYQAQAQTLRKPRTGPSVVHRAGEHPLVPRPLSWRKESGPSTPRSTSDPQNEHEHEHDNETSTTHSGNTSSTRKRYRLSDKVYQWVPHRLSVGPSRHNSGKERSGSNGSLKWKQSLRAKREELKGATENLQFSDFFTSSEARRMRRERAERPEQTDGGKRVPDGQSPAPILRLPLGLAIVRTPTPRSKSDTGSGNDTHSRSDEFPRSAFSSGNNTTDPASPTTSGHRTSDNRSSYNAGQQQSGTRIAALRNSHGSENPSRHSSNSSNRREATQPHHQVPQHSNPTQPQPHPITGTPPIHRYAPATFLQDSPSSVAPSSPPPRRESPASNDSATRKRLNLFEKVRDARRKHEEESRHDKLKKSIRVLGPTDPHVVEGYVKREGRQGSADAGRSVRLGSGDARVPGYMSSGPL